MLQLVKNPNMKINESILNAYGSMLCEAPMDNSSDDEIAVALAEYHNIAETLSNMFNEYKEQHPDVFDDKGDSESNKYIRRLYRFVYNMSTKIEAQIVELEDLQKGRKGSTISDEDLQNFSPYTDLSDEVLNSNEFLEALSKGGFNYGDITDTQTADEFIDTFIEEHSGVDPRQITKMAKIIFK
jgi:hypothetical protein